MWAEYQQPSAAAAHMYCRAPTGTVKEGTYEPAPEAFSTCCDVSTTGNNTCVFESLKTQYACHHGQVLKIRRAARIWQKSSWNGLRMENMIWQRRHQHLSPKTNCKPDALAGIGMSIMALEDHGGGLPFCAMRG